MRGRGLLTLLLLGAFALSLWQVPWSDNLLHTGGGKALWAMLSALFRPALSGEILALVAVAAWRTLAYAVAGMTLAVALAVPLGILASGTLAQGRAGRTALAAGFRLVLGFLRAIHELVWALLFVAAIGLSPFAAVFALGLPYAGILGRILAELLEEVPAGPLQALRSAGATEVKVLLYGRLPLALADMISYTLYRFECAIRSAAIMSFVGLGGLGYEIQISLADLRYNEVWTFVLGLAVLVVTVDLWSGALRKRLVA